MYTGNFSLPVPATDLSIGIDWAKVPEEIQRHLMAYGAGVIAQRAFAGWEGKPTAQERVKVCEELRAAWYAGKPSAGERTRAVDPLVQEGWNVFFAMVGGTRAEHGELRKLGFLKALRQVVLAKNAGRKVPNGKLNEAIATIGAKIRKTAEENIANRKAAASSAFDID